MPALLLHTTAVGGEAEMYASASGVSEGILLRKVLAFLGMFLGLQVLWLQQLIYKGLLTMTWQAGKDNNSDLGTKVLRKGRFLELRDMCGLLNPQGRTAQVASVETRVSPAATPQLLALTTLLLEMTKAKGDDDAEDDPYVGISPLVWVLAAIFLCGLLTGWLWAWCQRRRDLREIVDSLVFYESPTGTVLHLSPKCHYVRKSKLKVKKICTDCRAHFKEKTD